VTADAETATDADLWRRLIAGDREALGQLFDRHGNAVYNFAFRRTASWSVAEEVVQATFLTIWRRATDRRLPPLTHASALPWLLGVAGHEGQNATRSIRRLEGRRNRADAPEPLADHADDVAARIDDERRMAEVRRAMAEIPVHERNTIELVLWSGLSLAEAADVLHVAEGTVKSRLARGRSHLARLLIQASTDSEDLS
jgi:RNA polymerase sigma-70 factor (ECF subfamily)